MHAIAIFLCVAVATATTPCLDATCEGAPLSNAANASAMLQIKSAQLSVVLSAREAASSNLKVARTCVAPALQTEHLRAVKRRDALLAIVQAAEVLQQQEPSKGIFEQCAEGSTGQSCSVEIGSGEKTGQCEILDKSWALGHRWCDVGQKAPCSDKGWGAKCSFEGEDGICVASSFNLGSAPLVYCDVWPEAETTPGPSSRPAYKDYFEGCSEGSTGQTCSVEIGSGEKTGQCQSPAAQVWWCNVGQWAPCSAKGPGAKCSFEGEDGMCDDKDAFAPYCNVWKTPPDAETEPTPGPSSPPASKDCFEACSEGSNGQACSVQIGSGEKNGWCQDIGAQVWWCYVGQEAPCSGKGRGAKCSFEGEDGMCDVKLIGFYEHTFPYCDVWKTPPDTETETTPGPTTPEAETTPGPSSPPASKNFFEACSKDGAQNFLETCSVQIGSGERNGRCEEIEAQVWWCYVGQGAPCYDKGWGAKCSFEGEDGMCDDEHVSVFSLYCDVWKTPLPASKDYFGACSEGSLVKGCSVEIGSGEKPGQCQSPAAQVWWCNVGQEAPCSGKGPGAQCSFEGEDGICDGHASAHFLYCDVWKTPPDAETQTTPGPTKAETTPKPKPPPASKDYFEACSEGSTGQTCSVQIGSGEKTGQCQSPAAQVWWCDVGQKAPCSDKGPGAKCGFEGEDGICDVKHVSVPYCDIWKTSPQPETTSAPVPKDWVANSLKEAVQAGAIVLPVVSNSGFAIGQDIVIGRGTPTEEFNKIAGFGSLILQSPLLYDHGVGTIVSTTESSAAGATSSLDAAGFKQATSLCCPSEMEQFFARLLASKGLRICSIPHVQGLMHWFSCVPDMDFQYMLDVIANGNPCKYWTPTGTDCPILSKECEGNWCS